MDERILEFGALLRQHGLRISPAESLDALAALGQAGLGSRQVVKDVLRATMVKRSVDLPAFDELFDLYFSALGQAIREASEATGKSLSASAEDYQKLLEQLEAMLRGREQKLSKIAEALLRNDDGTLEKRLREAAERVRTGQQQGNRSFQEGQFAHALSQEIGLGEITRQLEELADQMEGQGLDPETERRLRELVKQRLADLAELLKRVARLEGDRGDPRRRDATKLAALAGPEFELRIVSARGTVVWPKMSPAFDHPGFFRSRFVARDKAKVVTDEALLALITRVAGVATWFHIEKLRSWNGEEGFSRAQGE